MQSFIYPARLKPDSVDGGFVVTFADLPEAITQGDDIEHALHEAADCLDEAIVNRIVTGLPIPLPSAVKKGCYPVPLAAHSAAKAALYIALQEARMTKAGLAKRLGCDEKEVRRLLDPRHPSKLPRLESALAAIGRRLIVGFQATA